MNILKDIIDGIIRGLSSPNQNVKKIVKIAIVFTIGAIIIGTIGELFSEKLNKKTFDIIALALGITASLIGFSSKVYDENTETKKASEKIEILEEEIKKNPDEPQTAWELARLKLESYLNKNLRQVSSIFYFAVFVMLVGFGLIGYGIIKVYEKPEFIKPSILATCSGIIINFIGGTLLFIYRSTMNQAKNYVDVLERINAIGMSIQILDSIDDKQTDLKEGTKAEIAKELLKIYGGK